MINHLLINIYLGGTTFHAGLRFEFGQGYKSVQTETLQKLRNQFEDMMMVIIDEVSMVGPDTLYKVHRRMVEICQMEDMFGDRGVMFVGGMSQNEFFTTKRFIFDMHLKFQIYCKYHQSRLQGQYFQHQVSLKTTVSGIQMAIYGTPVVLLN